MAFNIAKAGAVVLLMGAASLPGGVLANMVPPIACEAANAGQEVFERDGNIGSLWLCEPDQWVLIQRYWCDDTGCIPV